MARRIYDTASARQGTTSATAAKSYAVSVNSVGLNTFVRDPVVGSTDSPSITALIGDNSSDSYLILSGAEINYDFRATTTSSSPSVKASTKFEAIEAAASAKIDFSGSAVAISQTNGSKILLKDTLGKQTTFTYNTSSTSSTITFGLSGVSTDAAMATKFAACVNSVSDLKITATASGSVVTCKQDVPGGLGNTRIASTGFTGILKSSNGFFGGSGYDEISGRDVTFTAGGTYSATFDPGTLASASISFNSPGNYGYAAIAPLRKVARAKIAIKTATASDLSGEYITLSTPSQTRKFVWTTTTTKTIASLDDDGDASTTTVSLKNGDVKTGQNNLTEIYVQINSLTSSYDMAQRLQEAIAISGIALESYVANYTAAGTNPTIYLDQLAGSGVHGNTTISTDSDTSHVEVTSFTGDWKALSGASLTLAAPGGATSTLDLTDSFNKATGEIRFDSKSYISGSTFTFSNSSTTSLFSDVALAVAVYSGLDAAATNLASQINSNATLSSHITATAYGNRVLLSADNVGDHGNTISVAWSPKVSSVPAAQVAIQGVQNAASSSISAKYMTGGISSLDNVAAQIKNSARLSKDFSARKTSIADNCEEDKLTVVYSRPGTAGNSATVAFNAPVDTAGSAVIAASSIALQSTNNTANSGISAVNFTGGANNSTQTAVLIGVTDIYSSETPGATLATALQQSISQATTYGVSSSTRSTSSGSVLNVTSAVSGKIVTVTMSTAGSGGNAAINGTFSNQFTTNNGTFSGGLNRFYAGTSRTEYATNLVTLINTQASSVFSASLLDDVVLTGSRATGTIAFLNNTASNYSSGKIDITSSNGHSKAYEFSSNCGETGEIVSGNVMVYLGNVASSASAGYADEFLAAFHHRNGHNRYVYSRLSGSTLYLTQRKTGSVGGSAIVSTVSSSYLTVSGFSIPTASQIKITAPRDATSLFYSVTSSNTGTIYLTRSSNSDSRLTSFINPRVASFQQNKTSKLNNFDLTLGGGSENSSTEGQLAYLNSSYTDFFPSRATSYNSGGFLNEILNNRNGIYGAPTWRMWRQADYKKKVLQELDKNNLISVLPNAPSPSPSQDEVDSKLSFMMGDGGNNFYKVYLINPCLGLDPPDWCDELEGDGTSAALGGLALIGDDDGMLKLPEIFVRKKLKRLRTTQIFYEPPIESRHKPLLYQFTSQTLIGQSNALARQTLFNGLHFFTNKGMNTIYSLKDGEARQYITGTLGNSFLYDFFKTARSSGGRNFYFRERIYPGELNCRRSVNQERPEYDEKELFFYEEIDAAGSINFVTQSLMRHPNTEYLSSARRLSHIRSFWKTEKRDRVRNIYDAKFMKGMPNGILQFSRINSTPTSSLGVPYMPSPTTLDGKFVVPTEVSNYHFWDLIKPPVGQPGIAGVNLIHFPGASKRHFAAGIVFLNSIAVKEWQLGPINLDAPDFNGLDGLFPPPIHIPNEPLEVTSSLIIATTTDQNLMDKSSGAAIFPEDFNDSMVFIRKSGASVAASMTEMSFHQPYDFSLVSMWPLDFPEHLYSRHYRPDPMAGGKLNPLEDGPFIGAIQRVGLAPNRIALNTNSTYKMTDAAYNGNELEVEAGQHIFVPFQGTNQVGHSFSVPTSKGGWATKQKSETQRAIEWWNDTFPDSPIQGNPNMDEFVHRWTQDRRNQVTGAAGELIFSTKPTITLYDRNRPLKFPAPHLVSGKLTYADFTATADEDGDGVADYFEDDMPPLDPAQPANSTLHQITTDGFIDFDPENPTIELGKMHAYTVLSESQDSIAGYATATASMQFLRHAFPYYQPIWRLDKLTGRQPMHNSYLDFSSDVHTMGRDYSIVPEFCISDHLSSYQNLLLLTRHSPRPIYKLNEDRKIIRNIVTNIDYLADFAKVIGSSNLVASKDIVHAPAGQFKAPPGPPSADGPAPNSLSHSAMTTEYTASKEFYDLDYGDYSVTPNNITSPNAIVNWRVDAQSAKFMPKYMQTDTSENFAKLCRQEGTGFNEDEDTIPAEIHLNFKAIKKLLPEKDLYPVNRTVTIGSQLIDAFSESLDYSKKAYFGINEGVTEGHKAAAATQSFLEPLVAPGILYNSIKSGLGVSYPIFSDIGSEQHPLYYGDPHPYGDWGPGAWSSLSKPPEYEKTFTDREFKKDAKYLMGYGLASSMGIAKSTPTFLMRRPTRQLPFEAIYKPDSLNFMSKFKTYMVDDFFDQNRGEFVTGNLETSPHTWTYPTSSVTFKVTHAGEDTMIPAGDGAGGTAVQLDLYWHMPDTAVGYLDYIEYAPYFRGGAWFRDDEGNDAVLPRHLRLIPIKNNDHTHPGADEGDGTFTLTVGEGIIPGDNVPFRVSRYFKVGTSSLEYANNMAAAINSTASYWPFRVITDELGPDGELLYATKNKQLFTASVSSVASGDYVTIHTTAPLTAPHNASMYVRGESGKPDPTGTFGIPVNGARHKASYFAPPGGNASLRDIKLYFGSSGTEKNAYDPGNTVGLDADDPIVSEISGVIQYYHSPEASKDPRSNVATKIAAHEFKPHVQLKSVPEFIGSKERRIYESSINNFLAETINFFIEPDSPGRYYDFKMPIVASTVKQTKFNVVSGTTYYMSVNLYMGESHVMCEGPRFANIPNAGNWASASMRGAFFGPPMEVVHRATDLNGATSWPAEIVGGYTTEEKGVSSNLTDPAYHHVTPPYFYGPSSLLIKYEATGTTAGIDDIYAESKKTSFYFEEYITGMDTEQIDAEGVVAATSTAIFPTSSLSPKVPTKNSVSTGSAARMKLESSVDVWKDGFSLIDIAPLGGLVGNQVPARAWIMAPKWVCPVLDFGLPATIVRKPTSYNQNDQKVLSNREDSIKNTTAYYNYCTGRSMWLGYGVDPYNEADLAAMRDYLKDQESKMAIIENDFEWDQISGMQGKPVTHIVDPAQGPDACTPGKKGIYLQISETFPESFGGEVSSSITFATPFSGAENQSGFYTNREEVFGSAQTGSLVTLLGFDKTSGTAPRPIGKIASSKRITEAIVAIPYFEEGFWVRGRHKVGVPHMHDSGHFAWGGEVKETVWRDILSTTQIIPGYHFLKIDQTFFEKALGLMMVDRLTPPGSGRNTELRSVYRDYGTSISILQEMDLGQMLRTLLGEGGEARLGYVLPPEMDFINNSAIDPFQMVIAPFHHDLDRVDLANIWQNLAPDVANKASKVQTGVTLRPKSSSIGWHTAAIQDLIGEDAIMPDAFTATEPGQFLNPKPLVKGYKSSWGTGDNRVKIYGSPPSSPSDFYAKLRWMVFKVKQRAAMDYDVYKSRQVDLCLERQGIERLQTGDASFVTLDSLASQELYGSNWPYDFFSLIEKAKLEIEYRVEG